MYTTTVTTTRNVIAAYNLAQRMASLPQTLYTLLQQSRSSAMDHSDAACKHLRQFTALDECRHQLDMGRLPQIRLRACRAQGRYLAIPHSAPQGQQAIAAQGATVDLSDAVNASNLQTVGTIRANAAQREADISQLEAATHSTDPAQHTEMATFSALIRPC